MMEEETERESFWGKVKRDLRSKTLCYLKLLYFLKYGSLFVVMPFFALHMDSLGMNEWEIGINQGIAPVAGNLGSVLAGLLADKVGNFKALLSIVTLLNAPFAVLLLSVPNTREKKSLPATMLSTLTCKQSDMYLVFQKTFDCQLKQESWKNLQAISRNSSQPCEKMQGKGNTKNIIQTQDQERFPDITNLTELPTKILFRKLKPHNESKSLPIYNSKLQSEQLTLEITENYILNEVEYDNNEFCNRSDFKSLCPIEFETKQICKNSEETQETRNTLNFALYMIARIAFSTIVAISLTMFEGAVLTIIKVKQANYGYQRLFGNLTMIIGAPLSGFLVKSYGFFFVFYGYAVFHVLSAIIMYCNIDLSFKIPAGNVFKNFREVASNLEVSALFVCVTILGIMYGFIQSFLFLYLKQIECSPLLMGLTLSVQGAAGILILIFGQIFIDKFGHVNILCFCLLCFSIRQFGYSIITQPWMVFLFEPLDGITTSLALAATSVYALHLSNLRTIASVEGIRQLLYFGVGRGLGGFVGGKLIEAYGYTVTFRIFGTISIVTATLYALLNILYFKPQVTNQKDTS